MTKEDLMPLAKTYFDSNCLLLEIFGTEDHHFFYRKIQAQKYCGADKKFFHYLKEDFEEKKEVEKKIVTKKKAATKKSDKPTTEQLLQKEAKDLGIEFDKDTTLEDLQILIDLKKEEK